METSTFRKSQPRTGKAWGPTEIRGHPIQRSQVSYDKQFTRGQSIPLLSPIHSVEDQFQLRVRSDSLLRLQRGPVKDQFQLRVQSYSLLRLQRGPVEDKFQPRVRSYSLPRLQRGPVENQLRQGQSIPPLSPIHPVEDPVDKQRPSR